MMLRSRLRSNFISTHRLRRRAPNRLMGGTAAVGWRERPNHWARLTFAGERVWHGWCSGSPEARNFHSRDSVKLSALGPPLYRKGTHQGNHSARMRTICAGFGSSSPSRWIELDRRAYWVFGARLRSTWSGLTKKN